MAKMQSTGNKKSKKWMLLLIPLLLLRFLLLRPGTESTPAVPASNSPAEVFTEYLKEKTALPEEEETSPGGAAEAAIIENGSYEIVSQTDTTVTLKITAPDMSAMLQAAAEGELTTDNILAALDSGTTPTVTNEVTVELDETGNPVESWDFVDAMYGGLLSYLEQAMREMEGAE